MPVLPASAAVPIEIREPELKVFIDAVRGFFDRMQVDPAEIHTSYLSQDDGPSYGYAGSITLSGSHSGSVYFTAPRQMLTRLLVAMHEPDLGDANLLDAAGEVANTLAGNARRHFGAALHISVPIIGHQVPRLARSPRRERVFVILLRWCGQEAAVVVDITSAKRLAP